MAVLFFLLYCTALTIPGLAFCRLSNIRTNRFISAIAVSYGVFTLSFVTGNYLGVRSSYFLMFLALLLCCSLIYLAFDNKQRAVSVRESLAPVLVISSISFVYQIVVGPFTEVPADLYAHLERYQFALKNIQENNLGASLDASKLFLQGSGVFYHFLASLSFVVPVSTYELTNIVDCTNRTIFLIASYYFTKYVFSKRSNSSAIAGLATLLVFLHFGTSVFAYSRYYTLAPTMLNMVLYMFGVLSVMRVFNSKLSVASIGHYALIGLAVVCASAIHVQEAMYILVMIACLSVYVVFSRLHKAIELPVIATRQVWAIFALALTCFAVVYIYSHQNLPRAANAHWRLWDFGSGVWPLPQLTVLNLKKEFAQVITLWGVLVYLLFFLNIQRYKNNLFIAAAMLSPLLTILNPFFVDLFLRHYNSTTLWRLCYLIPIHLVAADLLLCYWHKLQIASGIQKGLNAIPIILLLALLMPIKNTWQNLHYSRLPSLVRTENELSATHYKDLLNYLDTIDTSETILTDPMTGYMVSAMTKHFSQRRKFFRDRRFKRFSYYDYSDNPLDQFKGSLLVVNLRPKSKSRVGAISNHWLSDQWLRTKTYYPPELLQHLEARPTKFKLDWSGNEVAVYKIL